MITSRKQENVILAKLAQINWAVVLIVAVLSIWGLAMMYSAGGGNWEPWAGKQTIRFVLAFAFMLAIAIMPMRYLHDYAYAFYAVCVGVLVLVEILGFVGMGAQRWVALGVFNLQPSEVMKLALILALARYFQGLHPDEIKRLLFVFPAVCIVLIPAALILRQPNLGTATILCFVGVVIFFMAGVRWHYFALVIGAGLAAAPIGWQFLHDYQKRRVLTFLDPQQDPLGAGYNIIQSTIAIGSGGIFGKGFLHGSQGQLDFLPEKQTDFIFTMLAEEFGFAGGALMLLLYGILLAYGLAIALRSRSMFGAFIAIGISAMLFAHVFINVAMVMGLIPVVGVPLPLMSYGGTIMFTMLMGFGLLLNAYVHRDETVSGSSIGNAYR